MAIIVVEAVLEAKTESPGALQGVGRQIGSGNFLLPIDAIRTKLAPGFRALSISVEATLLESPEIGATRLREACAFVSNGGAAWTDGHMQAWADVFRAFGAKPQRTPCSAEALLKRVLRDGSLPSLDPVVDPCNAISLRYAVPVGGENLRAYTGSPRLVVASGTELFDTVKEGLPTNESPKPGEVVWRDNTGVTCRPWN